MRFDALRIAVAHEWVAARAGSEKTFEALAAAFPTADLYALSVEPDVPLDTGGRSVETSFLDRPFWRGHRALSLPLMPAAWRVTKGGPYDVVVSSSHAAVKGFAPGRDALHLCYCHTPMRYAWLPELEQRPMMWAAGPARAALRRWDRRSADWVDEFAANSTVVAERIAAFYGRESRVLAPPVDVDWFATGDLVPAADRRGLVALSRWIGYKKLDLAIEAAEAAGLPITVAGSGPDADLLRRRATAATTEVVIEESPSDERVRELFATAQAVVFPAWEDFGLVPVEAQAAGAPVVAFAKGGARDSVVDGVTGALVSDQTVAAFAAAIRDVVAQGIDPAVCRANAVGFGRDRFIDEVRAWVRTAAEDAGLLG